MLKCYLKYLTRKTYNLLDNMAQGNFNKYRVKQNTDKPQVMADPILKFFNGGFLMPAKQGGILAYPNNNNQSGYLAPRMSTGGPVGIYGYRNYNNDILSNKAMGGQGPGDDELAFQQFFRTLPLNLRKDTPDYNIRGYWNGLGRPNSFDYTQPKQDDGYYHATSRNPQTGEILKAPFHPTFKQAISEDRKAGYFPIVTPDGKIKTVSGYDLKPGQSMYANGGDISIPDLNTPNWLQKYETGGPGPGDGKTNPPIYTYDPRKVRAYNDSLLTYNNYYNKYVPGAIKAVNESKSMEETNRKFKNLDKIYMNLDIITGSYPHDEKHLVARKNYPTGRQSYYHDVDFKKPVQPYILKSKPKPSEPKLKPRPFVPATKIPMGEPSKGMQLQLRTIPKIDIPPIQQGKYRVEYFDPSLGEETHRRFMSQAESDAFAKELGERNLNGVPAAGNITQRYEYQNGGGLLSRKVTCSNCGWSWDAVDGGKDPMTCHKCGGMIKMKSGGWINKYIDGGNTECPDGEYYDVTLGKCMPIRKSDDEYIQERYNVGVAPNSKADESLEEGTKNSQAFLRNWYAGRINDPRYGDTAKRRLAAIDKVKIAPASKEELSNMGALAYYTGKDNAIHLDPNNPESRGVSTQVHETGHFLRLNDILNDKNNDKFWKEHIAEDDTINNIVNPERLKKETVNNMVQPFLFEEGPPRHADAKAISDRLKDIDYYTDTDEIYSRLLQFRRRYNIDPTKKYTPDEMRKIIEAHHNYFTDNGEEIIQSGDFEIDYLLEMLGDDAEKLARLNNEVVMNNSKPQTYAKYGGWLNKYATGGFSTTETTTINPQDAISIIQTLRNDSNFLNEMKNRPVPIENYPNNQNRKKEPLDPRFITLEKKPLYSPFFNPRDFDKHALKSFDIFKEPQTYKNGGWLSKYDDGGFATTQTTTIKPNTAKKFPTPFKPNTNTNAGGYNFYTQNADDSYKLVTEQDWENQQSKDGVKKSTTPVINTGNIRWRNGTVSKLPSGNTQKITTANATGSQAKENFIFQNPYITPNPSLNDMVGSPDYWWSELGWNPEKQQSAAGMGAFARLYPAFATVNPDLEWTTSSDGRGAWAKRTHPWEIPGTPQYNALLQIKQLEDEKIKLIGKTTLQLVDPTGVSMWPDTWQSYKDLYNEPGVWNATMAGINTVASLPLVRYLGEEAIVPVKGAETTAKVAEITSKLDKLYTQYPQLTRFQKVKNAVVGKGSQALNYIGNSKVGKVLHYVGGEPFMKYFDKATGAEKLFKLPTTGTIQSFNKMERFGKASINLPINMYATNQDIKDLKTSAKNTSEEYYNFKREDGSIFQVNAEIQNKQLPGSIPFDAIDPDWNGEGVNIPLMGEKKLKDREIYIPAMYNTLQKKQTKLKKLPNKK